MISFLAPRTSLSMTSERGWSPTGYSPTTVAGVPVSEDIALTYSAVFACTRVLAGTGSSLPLPTFKRVDLTGQGLAGEGKERDRSHWLAKLLHRPTNELDGVSLRALLWHWMVNRGNADCEKVEGMGGGVAALLPIPPWHSNWERNPQGGKLELKVTYPGAPTRWLRKDQVFHLRSIITDDGWIGKGVIQHARECVGFGIATEKYGANWFGGGAVPRVAVSHPGPPLDDIKRKAFRDEWGTIYGGPDGAKVALLAGDAKVTPINISAEDSQFLETRKHNTEEICRWYGVPPHLIQRMDQVTYNNVEMLGIDFVRFTLTPWLTIWEQAISTQLLNETEAETYFAEHNVNGLMRGDSAARSTYYHTMTSSGLMTRNEARALENLAPVPGGDTFIVQGAMVPLDEDGKPESDFAGNTPQQVEQPDPEPESERVDNTRPAARIMLNDALCRMQGMEFQAATRAAKKPGEFLTWLDEFYARHSTTMAEAVFAPLMAVGNSDHIKFALAWCERSKNELLEAAGRATPAQFAEVVAEVVESWRVARIEAAIKELLP